MCAGEIFAVFEIEFVLSALFCRAGRGVALRGGIAENRGAELLVHQDSGLLFGDAA